MRRKLYPGRLAWLLLGALAAAPATAQVPAPIQGKTGPPAGANRANGTLPVFEFHSGFWINLHHVLYEQARLRAERPTTRTSVRRSNTQENLLSSETLSQQERKAWSEAVEIYAKSAAGHDLLFDTAMVLINNRLAEMADTDTATSSGFAPEMVAALERAAPVYRAHWWAEDDRANRAWIAGVAPLVERLGAQLARQLAGVYQANWPAENIRVDVGVYAGLFGAYTTLDPLHVTVSSRDPRNQGLAALEVLFHEASHGLAEPVRDAIARECHALDKPIPRELWHALLFYTTGEIVRRSLGPASGTPGEYEPYAYREGLYVRDWQSYERALEQFWRPYLDGRVDFNTAVAHLVGHL